MGAWKLSKNCLPMAIPVRHSSIMIIQQLPNP